MAVLSTAVITEVTYVGWTIWNKTCFISWEVYKLLTLLQDPDNWPRCLHREALKMHKRKYEDMWYYSFQDPSRHFLTYVEGRYFHTIQDSRLTYFFTYEEGKYFFEVARAEIFIFHHDWAEIFFWANMRAEIFISKKYQAPPLKVNWSLPKHNPEPRFMPGFLRSGFNVVWGRGGGMGGG